MQRFFAVWISGAMHRIGLGLLFCIGVALLPPSAWAQEVPATEYWWVNTPGCNNFFQPNGAQSTPAAACAFCTSVAQGQNGLCVETTVETGVSGTTCMQQQTLSCSTGDTVTNISSPIYGYSACANGYQSYGSPTSFLLCTPNTSPSDTMPLGDNLGGTVPGGINNKGPMCPACGNVGEPINPSIGNEFLAETDYTNNSAFALEFVRYYNSNSGVGSAHTGAHWRNTFDRSITNQTTAVYDEAGGEENYRTATVYRPDGKYTIFSSTDGVTWTPVADHRDVLVAIYNSSGVLTGWTFTTWDDHTETYAANGALLSIRDRAGRTQTLSYNAQGQLYQVLDSYGRKLQLSNLSRLALQIPRKDATRFNVAIARATNFISNLTSPLIGPTPNIPFYQTGGRYAERVDIQVFAGEAFFP